jgi:hypothetical protein
VVGLIVGTTIALAHVLEPGDWHWLIGRLAVVAVGAVAATGYYFWPWKTEK